MVDRCRIEAPELLADESGHATACHRTTELPPADAILPSDGGFSPALERLVAAFNRPEEASMRSGVAIDGQDSRTEGR
jgi:peptide/nickel transport system ATP-binding protein/oligopeptide transport system ATP-binding protein